MAPDIRVLATILSFVRTMLNPFHRDAGSGSSHTNLSLEEGTPAATKTKSSARRRNPTSSSSKGKRKPEMEDLLTDFEPKKQPWELSFPELQPSQQNTEATPPPKPPKVPNIVPNQIPENHTRRGSMLGLRRGSGTDRRTSRSSISDGNSDPPAMNNGSRDGADSAITGHQAFNFNDSNLALQRKATESYTNSTRPDSDWQIIDHSSSKPKLTYAQMSKQSQNDLNVRVEDRGNNRHGEKEHSDKREMELESLRKQLSEAKSHAKQAERAADDLRTQLQHLVDECKAKHKPRAQGNENDTLDRLQREIHTLKTDLDEARSHIFSLQPYQKDLTPHEVGSQFDILMSNVANWVTRFVDQVQDDSVRVEELLTTARKKPSDFARLRKQIEDHTDLTNACIYPETDIDIFIAIVTRFLHDNIFQKMLCGMVPKYVDVISSLETSMASKVEPKRDLYSLRTWRGETLNAVICGNDYQKTRASRVRELTIDLANIFRPFRRDKEMNKFYHSCQDDIILPAMTLQEAMSTSTHHFYLDLNPYLIFNTRQELELTPEFTENLSMLSFENILQNRKPLNLAKLQPAPTKDELRQNLVNVATLVPGLYMRHVGKGDSLNPPKVVRPQQMLVAWGPQKQREKYLDSSQRNLITQIYCAAAPKDRERQLEAILPWAKLPWN